MTLEYQSIAGDSDLGVIPLDLAGKLYSPMAVNSTTDPTDNYEEFNDTGAASFSGTDPSTYTYFAAINSSQSRATNPDETTVSDIVVTAIKNSQPIQVTTGNIFNDYHSTLVSDISVTVISGDDTLVDEIVVTPRYKPCDDGVAATIAKLTANSGEAIHADTMGALDFLSYKWNPDNPEVPAGYVLQNKYVSDDGSFISVMQRSNSNEYLFVARGSKDAAAFLTDAQLFLTPSVAGEMTDVKNWSAGVLTTIRNFDPTAQIFISGHSLGGTESMVMGATAFSVGFSASQVHVTALAPWAAANALSAAGLSGYTSALASSATAYWRLDDPTYMFRGAEVGNVIKTLPSDAFVFAGRVLAIGNGHDSCRYVSGL